jgi:formylglycine-generating enzyme required for sulfatase activity
MTASRRLGKYEILEEIGRGGFAVVYKARDTTLNRVVALKVLHPQLVADPKFVQRFLQEAQIAAQLDHPHIVTIHEIGEEAGQHYLAMAFLPGRTLDKRIAEGPPSVEQAISIVEQVADALGIIHKRGLVHRDIKPANIMVDDEGHATLLDFGIVRAAEGTRLTTSMAILGTPEYMAPEQADPAEVEEIDWRADIYALGVVAYEMLVGRPPFTGKSPTKVLYQHVHEPPPQPTTLNPNLPAGLGPVLLKALAKQRENRFQRAQTFAAQMRQSLLAKDQVTQQESSPPRLRSRRTSAWVWIAGVAFGLLIAIPVVLGSIPWPSQKATPVPSSVPTQSPTQQATEIPTEPPIETSAPTLGDTRIRSTDNMVMVYAPAGKFKMGSDDADLYDALQTCNTYRGTCQREWFASEQPVHAVTLDGLWVDQTEVTNAQFAAFLNANGNQTQEGTLWLGLDSDYSLIEQHGDAFQPKDGYADYPVVQVSWYGAAAYCEWAGGRLPSEAEWEYAARGEQRTVYPWGDTFDGTRLNFCDVNCTEDWREAGYNDGHGIAAPVSSFPAGASWCGTLNLSGNVWEWVADWYGDYPSESQTNPIGPPAGEYSVLRGGSWNADQVDARTARRNYATPTLHSGDVGFRCVIHTTSSTHAPPTESPTVEPTSSSRGPWIRSLDGMIMVYVPAGTFQMGSDESDPNAWTDEFPRHPVALDSFWIDQIEVTNAQYALCVADGKCEESAYAGDATYNGDDYPVVGVSRQDALNYCIWAGGRLPTEAEWEYTARGPDGYIYPWGNHFDCAGGNFGDAHTACNDGYDLTAPVGQFRGGASWCGALDMAGNVWEWVHDWYDDTYYGASPSQNPTGPATGSDGVLRGGSCYNTQTDVRATKRYPYPPHDRNNLVGFRCTMSAEE